MHEKKKIVKQIYIVKRDGRKDTSSDLNTIDEKPINVSKTSAISDKGKGELSDDIPSIKSEQSIFKGPKIDKEVPLSKDGVQPRCPLSTSNWQKKNLHAAASYSPLGPSMPISQAPHPTSLDRYSSRG